jgi:hypothetical protein
MIGAIPNPTRSFQIQKPFEEIYEALLHLNLFTSKYNLYKENRVLQQVSFDVAEFLSAGAYIDVNLHSISENSTQVQLEVRRKMGTFNQPHEVSLANRHIEDLSEVISKSISSGKDGRQQLIQEKNDRIRANNEKQERFKKEHPIRHFAGKYLGILIVLGIVLLGGAYVYKENADRERMENGRARYESKLTQYESFVDSVENAGLFGYSKRQVKSNVERNIRFTATLDRLKDSISSEGFPPTELQITRQNRAVEKFQKSNIAN